MKKILKYLMMILLLFISSSGVFAKNDESFFKKISSIELVKFKNGVDDKYNYYDGEKGTTVGWRLSNSKVRFVNSSVFYYGDYRIASEIIVPAKESSDEERVDVLDSGLNKNFDFSSSNNKVSTDEYKLFDVSHWEKINAVYDNDKLITADDNFKEFTDEDFVSNTYVIGDYIYVLVGTRYLYSSNGWVYDYSWDIYKFDKNLDLVIKHSLKDVYDSKEYKGELEYYNFDYDDSSMYIMLKENNFDFNKIKDDNKNGCQIYKVSYDLKKSEELDCNYENYSKYFSNYNYRLVNNIKENEFEVRENEKVFIKDDKLEYYKDDKLVFNIKAEDETSYSKVKFLNDKIILLHEKIYNVGSSHYIGELLVYDLEGNKLQTISDNSSYIDFDVDTENNKIVVSELYLDGVCNGTYYFQYGDCNALAGFEVYELAKKEVISNPETDDFVLILFIGVLIISAIIFFKTNSAKIEY